jgi:hypothetical protein
MRNSIVMNREIYEAVKSVTRKLIAAVYHMSRPYCVSTPIFVKQSSKRPQNFAIG